MPEPHLWRFRFNWSLWYFVTSRVLKAPQVIDLCSQVWEWWTWTQGLRCIGPLPWLSSVWTWALCSGDPPPAQLWWRQHLSPGSPASLQARERAWEPENEASYIRRSSPRFWMGTGHTGTLRPQGTLCAVSGRDTKNDFSWATVQTGHCSISFSSSSNSLITSISGHHFNLVSDKQPPDPLPQVSLRESKSFQVIK